MRGSTNSTAPARAGAGNAGGRFAVALAAAAALLAFAAVQRNAQHAAESAYLALLAAVVLAAVAALPARRRPPGGLASGFDLLPWAAVLAVLAAVALPPGAGRGAGLVALLAAVLAAALPAAFATAPHGALPRRWLDEVAVLLPAAVAVQVLYRGGGLLAAAPALHVLVLFVALPVATAVAVASLAVRHGRGAALVAAALALLACDGLDATATVVLVALAAGGALARPPAGGAVGRWAWRAAAAALLLAPFAWQPRSAAVALATALAVAALGAPSRAFAGLAAGTLALAAVVAAVAAPVAGWEVAGGRWALGLLLAPLWPLAAVARPRPAGALAVLALALAAARCASAEAFAAPLALAALTAWGGSEGGDGGPPAARHRGSLLAQGAWSALLLAAAALAAAYPWLRDEPVRAVLAASRLPTAGWGAVAGALFVALASLALLRLPRRAGALLAAALALFVFAPRPLLAPHATRPLLDRAGAHLTAAEPAFERTFEAPLTLDRLVADGNLSNAAELPQGTPVATVRLFAAAPPPDRGGGVPVAVWTLTAGVETAEWAASRPDVAPGLAHRMPRPWLSWVSPEGDCFGHTYRARFEAAGEIAVGRVSVERDPGLPPEVVVHLERLEGVS